jgi:hypothetical protein
MFLNFKLFQPTHMENESNWEPGVKKYFQKVMGTVSWTLMWLIACATAGIYFQLGFIQGKLGVANILFFAVMLITGIILFRYLLKTWK